LACKSGLAVRAECRRTLAILEPARALTHSALAKRSDDESKRLEARLHLSDDDISAATVAAREFARRAPKSGLGDLPP
jgi:hypothetical protein